MKTKGEKKCCKFLKENEEVFFSLQGNSDGRIVKKSGGKLKKVNEKEKVKRKQTERCVRERKNPDIKM